MEGEEVIASSLFSVVSATEALLPHLTHLLAKHEKTKEEITFIAIGNGPGSFTGTRIGVMTAKALSMGLNIPLVPFNSLMLYAEKDKDALLARDAKSGFFYLSSYEKGTLHPPYLANKEAIPKEALQIGEDTPLSFPVTVQYCLNQKKCSPHEVSIDYLKNPS